MARKEREHAVTILIVDDHAIFRHGLRDILARHFADARFAEAETATGALEHIRTRAWDIMVLDVTIPGRGGLEILKEVKKLRPNLPVLMLSMHPEEQYAIRVLQAGASGYITKIRAPLELVEAVKKVLSGGKYISPGLAESLVNHIGHRAPKTLHERLSNREFQVLRLMASGKSAKNIAHELSVSPQTISTHRARILKKLGLKTTAALIRYAVENELID